ncbi:MAG: M6 family metalloprotease domain-containing protein [Tenuifilaceae bacterium]
MIKHLQSIRKLAFTAIIGVMTLTGYAVPKHNLPITITQPDGTKISCFVSGDEFHNWLHDAAGYTIMRNPANGFYVYAVEKNGKLTSSDYVVGKVNPRNSKDLKPYVNISRNEYLAKRHRKQTDNHHVNLDITKGTSGIAPLRAVKGVTMNNIVVFIRFKDDVVADENISYYENVYNGSSASVANYYSTVSYGKFSVSSTFYPQLNGTLVTWYVDENNRNYYQPYDATTNPNGYNPDASNYNDPTSSIYREHTLLKKAVEAVGASIPTGINLDINGDNYIDVISFILAGSNDSWNDLLWPHQWSLWSQSAFINGKQVGDYTLQLQYFGGSQIDLGTLCHEMFHAVGAPDLYHYDDDLNLSPVGYWDIMEGTLDYPQNMGAHMKYLYGGWIDQIPEITTSGTYTLSPLATSPTGNSYKIPSPNSYSEYFVVEYRKKESYDSDLPGNGLLVYRINSKLEGVGNADGPPDEVYIYRPNGTPTLNGSINSAHFNSSVGRTSINDNTNPSSFLTDGTNGGLKISNITAAGETISFDATIDFIPYVVLKNDRGYATAIGDESTTLTVATRFTTQDLASLVGRKIKMVDFYIRGGENGSDVTTNETVKVWEGGTYGNPGSLIYSKNISSEVVPDQWTSHTLSQPIVIQPNKEYWVGYTATASGGYPFATDGGPMVAGKGGWIYINNQWYELININSQLNYNFLVRAVVGSETNDAETLTANAVNFKVFPNPANASSRVSITLPMAGRVAVDLYNMLGQRVGGSMPTHYEAGVQSLLLSGNELSNGIYLLTVTYDSGTHHTVETQKIVVAI